LTGPALLLGGGCWHRPLLSIKPKGLTPPGRDDTSAALATMPGVDPHEAIAEEEALLQRVRTALASAQTRRPRAAGPSRETLQTLREDAASAREEDAAPL